MHVSPTFLHHRCDVNSSVGLSMCFIVFRVGKQEIDWISSHVEVSVFAAVRVRDLKPLACLYHHVFSPFFQAFSTCHEIKTRRLAYGLKTDLINSMLAISFYVIFFDHVT